MNGASDARTLARIVGSGDDQEARRAIRACGDLLREGGASERAELLDVVLPLVRHASPIVRLAVADVCEAFPEASFDEAHALLLADSDRFVRAAAKAAGDRRAQQRRRRSKSDATDLARSEALAALERIYGKEARKLGDQAVEHGVEQFAQLLDHETRKTKNAIHVALAHLATELERPERSIGVLKKHAASLRERAAFVFSIVQRAREYATRVTPEFAEDDLANVVEEARAQLVVRLGPRAQRVALAIDVEADLRAEVDRYALLQALQNVLQNAVEAYDENAGDAKAAAVRVAVKARRGGSEIELCVADDGVGIPEDRVPALFVPFGSRKPGGTGVGMLIVRRMIEEVHGGALTIASKPGVGTSVTMVIPTRQRR